MNKIIMNNIGAFDCGSVLDCGQAFRWKETDDSIWQGIAYGRVLNLKKGDEGVELWPCTREEYETIWRDYFDADNNYTDILADLRGRDSNLSEVITQLPGLRLLRQQQFECLISFIISANNNIQRIKGIIERLCRLCGEEVGDGLFAFPSVEALAARSEDEMSKIGAGYRAPWIVQAAREVENGFDLTQLKKLPLEEARKKVMQLKGVGEKVANCILLFSCDQYEAFPVDTWMKKVVERQYGKTRPDAQNRRRKTGDDAQRTPGALLPAGQRPARKSLQGSWRNADARHRRRRSEKGAFQRQDARHSR